VIPVEIIEVVAADFLLDCAEQRGFLHGGASVQSVDQPPSVAQGGKGVVVPGCPASQKRINTMSKFLDHLAEDAMPALIEKLSQAKTE
jgi:hypothetical protein